MKRSELIRELERKGCVLHRHGGRHDIYINPSTGQKQPVPRHAEIDNALAKHIKPFHSLRPVGRLTDLRVPPGNRLEALKGERVGQHSIRMNDQWRVCFRWTEAGAEGVEIVDYH